MRPINTIQQSLMCLTQQSSTRNLLRTKPLPTRRFTPRRLRSSKDGSLTWKGRDSHVTSGSRFWLQKFGTLDTLERTHRPAKKAPSHHNSKSHQNTKIQYSRASKAFFAQSTTQHIYKPASATPGNDPESIPFTTSCPRPCALSTPA